MRTLPLLVGLLGGCVAKGKFEVTQVQLDATRMALQSRTAACHEDLEGRDERLHFIEDELDARRHDIAARDEKIADYEAELERYRQEHAELHQGEVLPGQAGPATVDEMSAGLELLSRYRMATTRRVEEFQELQRHLQPLVVDGRLVLVHEQGRLLIRIPSDPVFTPEGHLSEYGTDLVTRLAAALADLPPRSWQVGGHTDNVARHSAKWPSNWELGFDEAVELMRALHDAGFEAPMSAASYADTQPLSAENTDEGRRTNRRLEILLVPDLTTRPGNAEIEALQHPPAPEPAPTPP